MAYGKGTCFLRIKTSLIGEPGHSLDAFIIIIESTNKRYLKFKVNTFFICTWEATSYNYFDHGPVNPFYLVLFSANVL